MILKSEDEGMNSVIKYKYVEIKIINIREQNVINDEKKKEIIF